MKSSTDNFALGITPGPGETAMVEPKRQRSLPSWSLHSSVGRLIINPESILDSVKD